MSREKREYPDRPYVGVGVIVFRDQEVLLVKRNKDPNKGFWSIPGGKQILGETLIEAAKELGLNNQVSFELADYREIKGEYDKIYSVGMFEHVGRKFYNKFFKSINKLLKKDGSFLLHTIGVVDKPSPPNKFINRYIFPGGICPSLSQITKSIEKGQNPVTNIANMITKLKNKIL